MKSLSLTISFVLFIIRVAFAQSDSARLSSIAAKLEKLSATHPVEKIYLQFNKPGYAIGDTIWFKGYVTAGVHHRPAALSGVLYVDLIDGNNKIVKSLVLKNNNGLTAGEFVLDTKL